MTLRCFCGEPAAGGPLRDGRVLCLEHLEQAGYGVIVARPYDPPTAEAAFAAAFERGFVEQLGDRRAENVVPKESPLYAQVDAYLVAASDAAFLRSLRIKP